MSLKDLLQQLHVVVEDLAVLDSSLTALFETAPNTDVTEHQQLVQVGQAHCIVLPRVRRMKPKSPVTGCSDLSAAILFIMLLGVF